VSALPKRAPPRPRGTLQQTRPRPAGHQESRIRRVARRMTAVPWIAAASKQRGPASVRRGNGRTACLPTVLRHLGGYPKTRQACGESKVAAVRVRAAEHQKALARSSENLFAECVSAR